MRCGGRYSSARVLRIVTHDALLSMLKSTVTRLVALFIAIALSVAHGQELDLSTFRLTFQR